METSRMGRRFGLLAGVLLVSTGWADWSALESFQGTMPRSEFEALLTNVYCPSAALTGCLSYASNSVTIFSTPEKTNALFTLRFGTPHKIELGAGLPAPHTVGSQGLGGETWRSNETARSGDRCRTADHPTFRRIVLDPGHIGGEWARMEERWFVRGKGRPVQEALLNLQVARRLRDQLAAAGCEVTLTKDNFEPVTAKRPEDFRAEAARTLSTPPGGTELERDAGVRDQLRKRMEQLFYRSAEITARAQFVNESARPDLTICLHFNAIEWNERNDLVDDNRLVVFVHGDYLPSEVVDDAQKLRLFYKLLSRSLAVELPVAESVATALAQATRLPAAEYGAASSAVRVGTNAYVYARNLAANRLIDSPVVFLEPYYMNNRIVYQRIQLGDYDGEQVVEGKSYRSIIREYADAVAAGLNPYFKNSRPGVPPVYR